MRIKAQTAMVINLDKCLGCHTCSVTCKNTWTNRPGAEYMWWNNVETRPGTGYPKQWENQDKYRGGWLLKNGKPALRAGNRVNRLLHIFHNPDQPLLDDYYEPWTYNYERLTGQPAGRRQPVARPESLLAGKYMDLTWGPNWEDDLAGTHITGLQDANLRGVEEAVCRDFQRIFMAYLPRTCAHCLNPACVAACPSGAIYKRDEDGIVLVDQQACRGWRFCVSACPYKKIYYNWQTNKAEKCIFCFPRLESGLPATCAETCAGRVRYLGLVLYDADAVAEAAAAPEEKEICRRQRDIFLDPAGPNIIRQAEADGIPADWLEAARRSPVYKLAVEWGVALPLHPEYRTLPMVWYIPPLSPLAAACGGGQNTLFPAVDEMRLPVHYLANLLAAGDGAPVRAVLKKLIALRIYMRALNLGKEPDRRVLADNGLDEETARDMYHLLAVAKYSDRFAVPPAHRELAAGLAVKQGSCGLDFRAGPAAGR
ncbi:nitrate reductase subunit beta [Desulfotomaculum copahuensis]|uniref:Nitrate reductase subunit beta n=1 Tax=Desulfotomaculum copahuensis TaxID=1838280 RepID=A0A1B7LHW6_9FIRM|nr:nitrate reductase subunit beta [Desulfotomaculum copahuensis]OAT85877.1 nitrate reductase subunit beta [Desulfotomaculum copahuensis]